MSRSTRAGDSSCNRAPASPKMKPSLAGIGLIVNGSPLLKTKAMTHQEPQKNRLLSCIEILVILVIVVAIVVVIAPFHITVQSERGKRASSLANVRSIVLACRAFESEWGLFPDFDPKSSDSGEPPEAFSTSTEVFNVLIPAYIDTERIFWAWNKDPKRSLPPREDGLLESHENVYCYVAGQQNTSEFHDSLLVADGLMDSPGKYGEFHPWLGDGRALVGFVGGHAIEMNLTSKQPDATVRSDDGSVMNIFEQRETDASGQSTGGWLATEPGNILLPD